MKYILSFLFAIALIGCADEYNPEIGYNYDEVQQIITESSRVDTLYIASTDKDTVVVNNVVSMVDTLILNSIDTVLNVVRDTVFVNSRDTMVISKVDTVVVSKIDTIVSKVDAVVSKDTVVISRKDTMTIINQLETKLTCHRVETFSNGRISVCENDSAITHFYENGVVKSVRTKQGSYWTQTEYYENGALKRREYSSGSKDSCNQAGYVLYSYSYSPSSYGSNAYYTTYEYLNDTLLIKENHEVSKSGSKPEYYYVNFEYASTDLVNIKTWTIDYIDKVVDGSVWNQELYAKDNSWRSSASKYADGSHCYITLYVVNGYREDYISSSDCGKTWDRENFEVPEGFDIY
ncbi:MAG: hypothetical protein MJY87_11285 [Fibrobacter sp.]|nr:hypothetical protein [Fibrobacter sp.]